MPRRLFIIVCTLILTACLPSNVATNSPLPIQDIQPIGVTVTPPASPLPPTEAPTTVLPPEPSPTVTIPIPYLEVKPVSVMDTKGKISVHTAHPEVDALVQKLLEKAKGTVPENQGVFSVEAGTASVGSAFLWIQAGSQPMVALDQSGKLLSPQAAFANLSAIAELKPLGPPTNPDVKGGLPVPELVTYAIQGDRIVGLKDGRVAVEFIPDGNGAGTWNTVKPDGTKVPLQTYGENIFQYFELSIPLKPDGHPDFSVDMKSWFVVPEGRANAQNIMQWFDLYVGTIDARVPQPQHLPTTDNQRFNWYPAGSTKARQWDKETIWNLYLLTPKDKTLPPQNEVFPGITFTKVVNDPETGKSLMHIMPIRIWTKNGFSWVPVAISDLDFKDAQEVGKQKMFNGKLTVVMDVIMPPALQGTDLPAFMGNGDTGALKVARAFHKAGLLDDTKFSQTKDWVQGHFSNWDGAYTGYDPAPPPPGVIIPGFIGSIQ